MIDLSQYSYNPEAVHKNPDSRSRTFLDSTLNPHSHSQTSCTACSFDGSRVVVVVVSWLCRFLEILLSKTNQQIQEQLKKLLYEPCDSKLAVFYSVLFG